MPTVVLDQAGEGIVISERGYAWLVEHHAQIEERASCLVSVFSLFEPTVRGEVVLKRRDKAARCHPALVTLLETLGPAACMPGCEITLTRISEGADWRIVGIGLFEIIGINKPDA
jgi:hypothetical protein